MRNLFLRRYINRIDDQNLLMVQSLDSIKDNNPIGDVRMHVLLLPKLMAWLLHLVFKQMAKMKRQVEEMKAMFAMQHY